MRIVLERNGVASTLAWERPEGGKRFTEWKFTTLRHWGEQADAGPFTIRVADMRRGSGPNGTYSYDYAYDDYDDDLDDDGVFVSWTLQVYGHLNATTPAHETDDDDDDDDRSALVTIALVVAAAVVVIAVASAAALRKQRPSSSPVDPGLQVAHPTKEPTAAMA